MLEVIAAHNAGQARLARLFEQYAPKVEAYLTAALGRYDWHHAPDLASRTWALAAQDSEQCPAGAQDAYAWLLTIGARVVAGHRQAAHRRSQNTDTAAAGRGRTLPAARTAEDMAAARQAAHPTVARSAAAVGVAA
jgi:DNA-directed RNA polymerase specialized sigma24 family protein